MVSLTGFCSDASLSPGLLSPGSLLFAAIADRSFSCICNVQGPWRRVDELAAPHRIKPSRTYRQTKYESGQVNKGTFSEAREHGQNHCKTVGESGSELSANKSIDAAISDYRSAFAGPARLFPAQCHLSQIPMWPEIEAAPTPLRPRLYYVSSFDQPPRRAYQGLLFKVNQYTRSIQLH